MKLVSVRYGTQETVGLVWGDDLIDLGRGIRVYRLAKEGDPGPPIRSLAELLASGVVTGSRPFTIFLAEVVSFLDRHHLWPTLTIPGSPRLGPPIARPGKIICLGRNYAEHAAETDSPVPEEPLYFVKASTAVIGQDEEIVYPEGAERVDPEVELAAVIGRRARGLTPENALDCVLGYTILNDVTERSLQQRDLSAKQPWFRSKSYDTFCPLGPALVLTDEIPDPHGLQMTLRVNGEVRQSASTADMIFRLPDILVAITRHITLEPGDIVSTGTPQGIAPIRPGDLVECTIEGIGTLRNRVVAEKPAAAE